MIVPERTMTSSCHDLDQGHRNDLSWDTTTDEHVTTNKHEHEDAASLSSSSIENMPAELRLLVLLSMPDLPTLRSLIHASPVMHAQYQYYRDEILRTCLGRELDGFFIDAYATSQSRVRELGTRTDKAITDYLLQYKKGFQDPVPILDIEAVDSDRLHWMAAFHLSIVRPLACFFTNWAVTNLGESIPLSGSQQGASANEALEMLSRKLEESRLCGSNCTKRSRSEEIRIFQALYRFQTFQHLFGRNHGGREGGFRHHQIHELFFSLFNPWEAEAVGCIDVFIRAKYEEIFNEAKADLDPKNEKFKQSNGVYNPEGSYDLEGEHDDYLDGTVSRGLKITKKLLVIDDHEKLVEKLARCLTPCANVDYPMRSVLGSLSQNDRRILDWDLDDEVPDDLKNYPNAHDDAEHRRDPIHFNGDTVPPNGPPFAWVALWGGKYSNIYGEYVPESVRRWGYVMWDERRWIEMGVDAAFVAEQWRTSPDLIEEIDMDYDWRPEPVAAETIPLGSIEESAA
ncbi:hypothetical protein F5Y16DRAFT_384603 [Xylariaceae sp. FL0255]|nr:hypothetical protein F5Y16DRAFT_384603 [Xylariaceae sp. FL0255]